MCNDELLCCSFRLRSKRLIHRCLCCTHRLPAVYHAAPVVLMDYGIMEFVRMILMVVSLSNGEKEKKKEIDFCLATFLINNLIMVGKFSLAKKYN